MPVENRIGEENEGWTYAKFLLANERPGIAGCRRPSAACGHGDSRAAIGKAQPDRRSGFPEQIADLELQVPALEMTELRTLSAMAQGGAPGPEVSILKIRGSEIQQRITELAIEAVGYYAAPYPPGMLFHDTNETPVGPDYAPPAAPRYFNMRKTSIYGGSNEIQSNIIAKMVLGPLRPSERHDPEEKMDLSLSDEQTQLQDGVERFVRDKYAFDTRRKIAATERGWLPEIWTQFAELGWLGMAFSEEDGGYGGGPIETMIVMEQFGKGLVLEPFLPTVVLGGGMIAAAAATAQKEALLAPMIEGKKQFAFAWLERQAATTWPTSRSRRPRKAAASRSTATRPSSSTRPRPTTSSCSPAPPAARDEKGLTLFIVDDKAKGITRRDYPTVDGLRASELTFDKVSVGADAVLGQVDDAFPRGRDAVDRAIVALCAEATGCMEVLNDATLDYIKTRKQFGVPIGKFQVLQHRMVDMFINDEEARSMTLMVSLKLDDKDPERRRKAASGAKVQIGKSGSSAARARCRCMAAWA